MQKVFKVFYSYKSFMFYKYFLLYKSYMNVKEKDRYPITLKSMKQKWKETKPEVSLMKPNYKVESRNKSIIKVIITPGKEKHYDININSKWYYKTLDPLYILIPCWDVAQSETEPII